MPGIKHKADGKVSEETVYATEWNDDHKIDGDVDFTKHEAQNLVLHTLASAPASPVEGQCYYDSTQKKAYYYDSTQWKEFCPTIAMTSYSIDAEWGPGVSLDATSVAWT